MLKEQPKKIKVLDKPLNLLKAVLDKPNFRKDYAAFIQQLQTTFSGYEQYLFGLLDTNSDLKSEPDEEAVQCIDKFLQSMSVFALVKEISESPRFFKPRQDIDHAEAKMKRTFEIIKLDSEWKNLRQRVKRQLYLALFLESLSLPTR